MEDGFFRRLCYCLLKCLSPSVITLLSSSYAARVTLLPSLQQVPFPAALPSALSPGERRYPRRRSGQAREPLRLPRRCRLGSLPAGRGLRGGTGSDAAPRLRPCQCRGGAAPAAGACPLRVGSRRRGTRRRRRRHGLLDHLPPRGVSAGAGGCAGPSRGWGAPGSPCGARPPPPVGPQVSAAGRGRAAGRALPRGRPRPRPGGSALAAAAREQRLGRGRGSGSRPGRRQPACGALRGREALRVLRFLQADLRHPLPCVFLLQGREDEKREGICEYGFAVWARWSRWSFAAPCEPTAWPWPSVRGCSTRSGVRSDEPPEEQP